MLDKVKVEQPKNVFVLFENNLFLGFFWSRELAERLAGARGKKGVHNIVEYQPKKRTA